MGPGVQHEGKLRKHRRGRLIQGSPERKGHVTRPTKKKVKSTQTLLWSKTGRCGTVARKSEKRGGYGWI